MPNFDAAVLAALDEGVVVVDAQRRLLHANDAAWRIIGVEPGGGSAGETWWDSVLAQPGRDGAFKVRRPLLEMGSEARGVQLEVEDGHGEQMRLSLNSVPLLGAGGALLGQAISFHRVSDWEQRVEELEETQERLHEAQASARLASWEWRPDTDEVLVFRAIPESRIPAHTKVSLDQWLGLVPAAEHAWVRADFAEYRSGQRDESTRCLLYEPPSGPIWLEVRSRAFRDVDGRLTAVRGTAQDVSGRELAELHLREAAALFQGTLDSLSSQVAVLDETGVVVMTNRAWNDFAELNGSDAGATGIGSNYLAACDAATEDPVALGVAAGLRAMIEDGKGQFTVEYPCDGPDARRWFQMRATRYDGEGPLRVVVAHADITERGEAASALHRAAAHLRAVTDSMGEGVLTFERPGRLSYANPAARQMVGWAADETPRDGPHPLLRSYLPHGAPAPAGESRILRVLQGGQAVRVEDDLFMRADGSLLSVSYVATPFATDDSGEGCVVVFKDIAEQKARERLVEVDLDKLAWVARLEQALRNDLFVLHAQPIVDLSSGETVQRELLIRMRDVENPNGPALIAPGAFLPIAEEFGLIIEIDRWVIDRAAEIAAGGVSVELNVSGRSIDDSWLVDHIEAALERTGADPQMLVFEITETVMVSNEASARRFVERLNALGCSVALDDFGTGYGGFTYVKQLPIDYLKIDIEFVHDLVENPASESVVQAILKLAQGVGLKTVAEGVEDEATLARLRTMGVDYAQGYHIGRPEFLARAA